MRQRLLRAGLAALVAIPGTWALASSGYVKEHVAPAFVLLLGPQPGMWLWVLVLLAGALAALAFAMPRRRPLPVLGFAVLVALLAGYEASQLGWAWVFTRRAGTPGMVPDAGMLLPTLVTLAAALLAREALDWNELKARFAERGVPAGEVAAARRAGGSARVALLGALGLTMLVAQLVWALSGPNPLGALHEAAVVYPVVGLVALGALLWMAVRGATAAPAVSSGKK